MTKDDYEMIFFLPWYEWDDNEMKKSKMFFVKIFLIKKNELGLSSKFIPTATNPFE
jgi:hypothetical protein